MAAVPCLQSALNLDMQYLACTSTSGRRKLSLLMYAARSAIDVEME